MNFEWINSVDETTEKAWNILFDRLPHSHPEQHSRIEDLRTGHRFLTVRPIAGATALIGAAIVKELRYPFGVKRWVIDRGPLCRIEDLHLIASEISNEAKRKGISSLTLAPYFLNDEAAKAENILHAQKFHPVRKQGGHLHSVEVDLSASEDEIFRSFNGKTRAQLRKAEASEISAVAASLSDVESFSRLHLKMNLHRNLAPMPDGYFVRFLNFLEKHPYAGLFLVAKWQNRIVGGVTIICSRRRAWFRQGASDDSLRHLPLTFACHWQAMRILKAAGVLHYDLGGIDDADAHPQIAGINRFKTRFSNKEVASTREFEKVLSPFKHVLYTQGRRLEALI